MISRRQLGGVALTCALVIALGPGAGSTLAADTGLTPYEVEITDGSVLQTLAEEGFDTVEGRVGDTLEIVATPAQVAALAKQGIDAELKEASAAAGDVGTQAVQPDGSYDVYRPYFDNSCGLICYVGRDPVTDEPRPTLYEEMQQLADDNPEIVQPVPYGTTVNGAPMLALRVTRDAREASNPAGSKPAVLYHAAQHAREWITPEMVRRLAHLYVDNYGETGTPLGTDGTPVDVPGLTSEELTRLVNQRELWFVFVANPDGYDFTFTPGNRLWRKNLRDVNGDGQITVGDGIDLNRNLSTYWGYDNEGSADDPADDTYRGPSPQSEPETRALDGLLKDVGFEFMINYHSAAELLLYGHGFQVQTESPDDSLYQALSGTDVDPAIGGKDPGAPDPYDPDLSSELYTTNGETTEHAHSKYETLAWTPEMDVSDPARGGGIDTDWDGDIDEESDFAFQDSDADLQDAFEKNVPFALDVADSADDPDNPESHLGREAPNFQIRPFDVSYGDPQPVEINAKRELGDLTIHWEVNGGATQSASTSEFTGGERYGDNQNVYYHYVRGSVTGTSPGDDVKVWFEAEGGERSQAFTYEVRSDTGNDVLVLAAEDYSGSTSVASTSPAYPAGPGPHFDQYFTQALAANGIQADVYDIDAEGRQSPDSLGVLSHYEAVVWYTGNDLLTRAADQPGGSGVQRVVNDTIVDVRSYLNEGGKLLYNGQYHAQQQLDAYAFNVEGEPPYCNTARPGACIPLSNDFLQYWLGAYTYSHAAGTPFSAPDKPAASALQLLGTGGPFGSTEFTLNGANSADNQEHVYSMLTTSSILPESAFPLFTSDAAVKEPGPSPFDPPSGNFYAVSDSEDDGWQRLRKTIDLTGATTGELSFKISYDLEPLYDFVVVEAHPVGDPNDWTTLPDANGHTINDTGESCPIDWRSIHPFLDHYQTPGSCEPEGTTGDWHGATGNSAGFQDWSIDLSDYAGQQVEISISYVQDFASQGLGVFLDDVQVSKNGAVTETIDFETDFGGFTAGPPPAGSEPGTQNAWQRSEARDYAAGPGVATPDTLTWGFGFEGVSTAAQRTALMGDAMRYLGVLAGGPGGGGPGGGGGGGGNPYGEPPYDEPDTKAPKTKITKKPKKKTSSTKAKFKFRSNEAGSTFQCKLDRQSWKSCDSPKKYKNLDPGKHRFKVRAIDKAGNRDKSPAKYGWRIK